jgi:hypothetical protein
MHSIRDGDRTLQFNGKLLARSTSERHQALRWVEFELYKTESGSYILSRVGVSIMFHGAACPMVKKYKLTEAPTEGINSRAVPCPECSPDLSLDLVFPEKYRYWAMVTSDPAAILDSLYKYDEDTDNYYLTSVAQRLLSEASKVDSEIANVYTVEIIP